MSLEKKILTAAYCLTEDHLGEYVRDMTITNNTDLNLSQLVAAVRADPEHIDWLVSAGYFEGPGFDYFKMRCVELVEQAKEADLFLKKVAAAAQESWDRGTERKVS